jgi:hypothetical protein
VKVQADRLDRLVAALAPVRDDELLDEVYSARSSRLLTTVLEHPVREGTTARPRARLIVTATAMILAVVLTAAALGAGRHIRSWLSGGHGPDFPVPAAADVVIASGVAGVPWRIVATPSDQGLCLFLVTRINGEKSGSGGCGYSDIRGDLPPELRGDPTARCITTPTTLVPCRALPRHWIDAASGSTGDPHLTRAVVFAPAATDVAAVDIALTGGRLVRARLIERPNGIYGLSFYWATLPLKGSDSEPVAMVIARDARGRVLERRVPAWNGNPTGDPKGARAPRGRRAA